MNVITATSSITRPADTTTYAAGEVVSNTAGDRHTFSGLPIYVGGGGLIESALVIDSVVQTTPPDLELYLFTADVAAVADNAAFAPTDAELLTLVGIISFATASFKKGTVNMACSVANLGLSFKADKLFGVLVTRNAYVPPSNSEVFKVVLSVVR